MIRKHFDITKSFNIVLVLILASGLALAPSILLAHEANAAAQGSKQVSGNNLQGSFTCPSGTLFAGSHSGRMSLSGTVSRGTVSGSWLIQSTDLPGGQQDGQFGTGHITQKTFSFSGIMRDIICNGPNNLVTTSFQLTGQCGGSVALTTGHGERGTFSGTIACV
jgi:hypothetical protein